MMRVVHCKHDPYTRYIGRGSALGNPFSHLPPSKSKALVYVETIDDAVGCFEDWARGSTAWDLIIPAEHRERLWEAIRKLKADDVLGCYCVPRHACHGNVIVKLWGERRTMIPTYVILGNGQAIMCLECAWVSLNPNDVRERYCGNCHEYHDHKRERIDQYFAEKIRRGR